MSMPGSDGEGVKVLSTWKSRFGMRVLIALKEKGVVYEFQEEDLANKSALLLASNPVHRKVPVLLHRGRPICESLIIVQYIDDTWPSSSPLLPSDPHQRAQARFWADFIDKKLHVAGNRMVTSLDPTDREQAAEELKEALTMLDKELGKVVNPDSPFFGGKHIGFIDIAFAPFAFLYKTSEDLGLIQLPGPPQCPHLGPWIKSLLEYPSVKEVMAAVPYDKLVQNLTKKRAQARVPANT